MNKPRSKLGRQEETNPPKGIFYSDRERRLWLWTLVAVAGIFSTLALASTLADILNNQNLAAIAFLFCMFLVGVTVLTQGLKARPGGVEIFIIAGIAVVYFMLFLRLAIPERSHLIEFGVVAVFIYGALSERVGNGARVPVPALIAILMTTLVGVVDEFIQVLIPSRVFDPVDILFNFMAASMAVGSSAALTWAKRFTARWAKGGQG